MCESTILKLEKWVADTLHEDYEKIREDVVKSSAVQCLRDQFQDRRKEWLVVGLYFGRLGSYYTFAPTRGHISS
uniref:Uncharacterized protein n=1 Tax=Candidatus Methanogaster sp. ANME-2c ERB4 TaxID=2759911 RepID=A0A7G9Y3F4_9EURY|nr:hypothetical protein MMHALIEK_00013 [Methanosarcinales archaeon ANME-2c ERB4]